MADHLVKIEVKCNTLLTPTDGEDIRDTLIFVKRELIKTFLNQGFTEVDITLRTGSEEEGNYYSS